MLFNIDQTASLSSWAVIGLAFLYGLILDMSATAYLMLIPALFMLLSSIWKQNSLKWLLDGYTLLAIIVNVFIGVLDFSTYKEWGFRLDMTPFFYLKNPQEVLNFMPNGQFILGLIVVAAIAACWYYLYKRLVGFQPLSDNPYGKKHCIVYLSLAAFLVVPLRGGIGFSSINIGSVYFCNETFANHAAINPSWNLGQAYINKGKERDSYQLMEAKLADKQFEQLYPKEGTPTIKIINKDRPNVVLVILESFTSKLIGESIDNKEITPQLNKYIKEGLYFSNFYANGDRTDKGLLSILSGYPPLPKSIIVDYPNKMKQLPSLPLDLKKLDYQTAFYYGGDVNFANMKLYLMMMGVDQIIDKNDFDQSMYNANWGVHDHFVFERLYDSIQQARPPFFYTLLSLSNHQPFKVPGETVFPGEDLRLQFANAANYTDRALGDFVEQMRALPIWDNTLLIILADHGARYLDNCAVYDPEKFKIPMVWLGGALEKDLPNMEKISSQSDLPYSLLRQLDQMPMHYRFSKNIFAQESRSFSFYTFNNGFGFLGDSTQLIFDNNNAQYIIKDNRSSEFPDRIGEAYLQVFSKDYSKR